MAVVKLNLFQLTAKAIHPNLFGSNKTWRGFILTPLFTVLGCFIYYKIQKLYDLDPNYYIQRDQIIYLGILLGFFYVLFELPNSFIKRRLHIPPGQKSSRYPYLFIFIDQIDSVIGCLIIYSFYFKLSPIVIFFILIISPLIHLLINNILYMFKLRKHPF